MSSAMCYSFGGWDMDIENIVNMNTITYLLEIINDDSGGIWMQAVEDMSNDKSRHDNV